VKYAGGCSVVRYRIEGRVRLQKVGDLYIIRIKSFWSDAIVQLEENKQLGYQSQAGDCMNISRIQFLKNAIANDSLTVVLHRSHGGIVSPERMPKHDNHGLDFLNNTFSRQGGDDESFGHCLGKEKGEELTEPKVVRLSMAVNAVTLPQDGEFTCDFRLEASWTDFSADGKKAMQSSTSESLELESVPYNITNGFVGDLCSLRLPGATRAFGENVCPVDSQSSQSKHWAPKLTISNSIGPIENESLNYVVWNSKTPGSTSDPAVVCYVISGKATFKCGHVMGDTNESGAEQLVIQLKSDWTTKQVKLEENINPRYRSQVKCDLNLGQDYSLHTEIGFKQVGKRVKKQPVVVVGHCGSAKTQW
jgi:hypothetical protein